MIQKEERMPHVTVKIAPGRTEEQKTLLASAIVQDLVAIANVRETFAAGA